MNSRDESLLFFGSLRLFSMRISTEGLARAQGGPFLLLVRHASVADTVLAAAFVANPGHLLLRYVLKRELLWDPCLDIVGRRLPNAFVKRRGPDLDSEVASIAGLARGLDTRSAVLIYPEGKRFSDQRRVSALAALEEKGPDELAAIARGFQNVLPPRLRGPLALVGRTLHVRLRRFPASAIPAEGRDRWLFERWAEMDAWISEASVVMAADAAGRSDS